MGINCDLDKLLPYWCLAADITLQITAHKLDQLIYQHYLWVYLQIYLLLYLCSNLSVILSIYLYATGLGPSISPAIDRNYVVIFDKLF